MRQSGSVAVERHRGANLSTQQLIDRHAETLAQDVPQRAVDAAQRVVALRARAEVLLHIRGLPDVLDVIAVLADDERLQTRFDIGLRCLRNLLVGRGAEAIEAWLAGFHFDDRPVGAGGRGGDDLDVGDLQRRHAPAGRIFCLRQRTAVAHGVDDAGSRFGRESTPASKAGDRTHGGRSGKSLQQTTTFHAFPSFPVQS